MCSIFIIIQLLVSNCSYDFFFDSWVIWFCFNLHTYDLFFRNHIVKLLIQLLLNFIFILLLVTKTKLYTGSSSQ